MLFPESFKKRKKLVVSILLSSLLFLGVVFSLFFFIPANDNNNDTISSKAHINEDTETKPTDKPNVELITPPSAKTLTGGIQIFQRYNNCGPASLSMALSYHGVNVSQEELGNDLRPYQVPSGDNDDKSTTLEELAEKSKEYGLIPFHRPVGNPEVIKYFITYDLPVITRTWTKPDEDIGHYRVVKGYDSSGFIQDDSLQGKDIHYTFEEFDAIWKQFNYEYLVLVPEDKVEVAKQILGDNADEKTAWENAVENARNELSNNPNDVHSRFNLSVALANIGEYQQAVNEFEQVENQLSFRTLWYQIEPIQAYYELGEYERVFEISDRILNNHNRAFSELYIIRGDIYKNQGNIAAARAEYEKAVLYNENLAAAKEALNSL